MLYTDDSYGEIARDVAIDGAFTFVGGRATYAIGGAADDLVRQGVSRGAIRAATAPIDVAIAAPNLHSMLGK